MNPPDRRQAWEAPSHTYSNWTFIPTTISPLSDIHIYSKVIDNVKHSRLISRV